mgnify:CR=1 FL=1
MMETKILVVDDEADIVELVSYNLKKEGFTVITASNGREAVQLAADHKPEVVILDVMMPGMNGFEVCAALRSAPGTASASVVFLTARSTEIDQLRGLELGADDYIQKPVSPRILTARVRTILRRRAAPVRSEVIVAPETIRVGSITIQRRSYTVWVDGKEVFFPKKEFELLAFLAANSGRVFSREALLREIWGETVQVVDRTVDVHVSKVREKLGVHAALIETVKGLGYQFKNV